MSHWRQMCVRYQRCAYILCRKYIRTVDTDFTLDQVNEDELIIKTRLKVYPYRLLIILKLLRTLMTLSMTVLDQRN